MKKIGWNMLVNIIPGEMDFSCLFRKVFLFVGSNSEGVWFDYAVGITLIPNWLILWRPVDDNINLHDKV